MLGPKKSAKISVGVWCYMASEVRIRTVATVSGGECAKDRGSEIRDAVSRATAGDERQSGKV